MTYTTHETITETSAYGTFEVTFAKTLNVVEIAGREHVRETIRRNGQVVFSAQYPLRSEYARQRFAQAGASYPEAPADLAVAA